MAILEVPLFPETSEKSGLSPGVAPIGSQDAVLSPPPTARPTSDGLDTFHPAVREWFTRRFADGPTPPQEQAWPHIAAGRDTLVAAPTGSGKTLAGFLVCINQLYFEHDRFLAGGPDTLTNQTHVVYVSPLRALAVDIAKNLETPLREIAEVAAELGMEAPELRVGMRSGDTTQGQRAAMLRKPPHFVVTTPESLYLLATGAKGRDLLRTTRTVIIDEIHAMARDKRGSHLALTLERLTRLCVQRPVRVGLSATQRPLDLVARILVGAGPDRSTADGSPRCAIVDTGHRRELDLDLHIPSTELEAVASTEQMAEILDHIAELVSGHTTTIVFVNTRRLAERVAHQLGERLGDEAVAAHHGSLSKDRRARVEDRLRAGDLRALVATASLELGIDVGPVDLVCQLASPRSIATFLQRVGRSGHSRHGTPKGRLFPLTRDELVECSALLAAIHAGRLDALFPPEKPLDILAQQLVAEVAADDYEVDDLYELFRKAGPYATLSRDEFDKALQLVTLGIQTGRGTRAAYLHLDAVNGQVTARRGARLAAVTSGGAIPELADYRVVAEPDETFIGTVSEDWAIDSMVGDIFLLGSHSWRIRRVEAGTVRVTDAGDMPPTVPAWFGEAPARTQELSQEISDLRAGVAERLAAGRPEAAHNWLRDRCGISDDAATLLLAYLRAAYTALGGVLPTQDQLVIERFFDESGGMQLVVHCPWGGRINRGLGLALRKKFCASFDFELQAAANDDAVVLSLGPMHSFPLSDVARYLHPNSLRQTLSQAILRPPSPLFASRWRWNLNRSLVVLRFKGGRKNPPPIQRMESDDVMASVFPSIAACQENVQGPLEIPDNLLAQQAMHDTLTEAMDIDGLIHLVAGIVDGDIEVVCRDTTEASPLTHELLSGKPFTFLDDAPLEERRTRAVNLKRGIAVDPRDIGTLDHDAIDRVREEATPTITSPDELHDLLMSVVVLADDASSSEWALHLPPLLDRNRAIRFTAGRQTFWCPTERVASARAIFGDSADGLPDPSGPSDIDESANGTTAPLRWACDPADIDSETALVAAIRGHLEITGPITAAALAERLGAVADHTAVSNVDRALTALEVDGFAFQGDFLAMTSGPAADGLPRPSTGPVQWCARRLLSRIHAYTRSRRRGRVQAASAQDFMRFLLAWHHATPDRRLVGPASVGQVVEMLQGWEVAAGAWEPHVLASRIHDYRPELLDQACLGGEVIWLRLAPPSGPTGADAATGLGKADQSKVRSSGPGPKGPGPQKGESTENKSNQARSSKDRANGSGGSKGSVTGRGRPTKGGSTRPGSPSRATPISLVLRNDLDWLLPATRSQNIDMVAIAGRTSDEPAAPASGLSVDTARVVAALGEGGARFATELAGPDFPAERVEAALWDAVVHGLVTADGFGAVRALLASRTRSAVPTRRRRGLRRGANPAVGQGGRWSLVPGASELADTDEPDLLAEAVAEQLLARWGVVVRDICAREQLALPWREVQWALRRLEARGTIVGGRFLAGFGGEQFALPEAAELLGQTKKTARQGQRIDINACDPLNLTGVLFPGPRIPALRTNTITYIDGLPNTTASCSQDL